MDVIFLKLFNMSIAAGWLILAVIVLRLVLRKAPKGMTCVLWAVVAVRLVCPFTVESVFSLIPSAEVISPEVVRYAQEPAIDSGIPAVNDVLNPIVGTAFVPAPGASVNPLHVRTMIASVVWVVGMLIMLGYAFLSFLRVRIKVREAVLLWIYDKELEAVPLQMTGKVQGAAHLRRQNKVRGAVPFQMQNKMREVVPAQMQNKVQDSVSLQRDGKGRKLLLTQDNVWSCDAVKSPFILGIVRPRIYLSSSMDEKQLKYVLAHEQAHLRRGDHLWKPLGYLLLAVYWFQPLVWAAYILFCRDIELACDETVIRDMDISAKKEYCRALLACSMQRKTVMVCPLAFGEVGVKERVKIVLNYRKPGFWIVAAGAAACVVIAVCFLTDPKTEASGRMEENTRYAEGDTGHDDSLGTGNWSEEGERSALEKENNSSDDEDILNGIKDTGVSAGTGADVDGAEGTITFTGVIVENMMDSTEPTILVQPMGDELPYNDVYFVLPDEEADWIKEINTIVSITCGDAFAETDPPFGNLLSIKRDESFPDIRAMFDTFGIEIRLPGNVNWIQDREYRQPDESRMEIDYHDAVLDADCRLLAVRDGEPDLPDIVYDASMEETWTGTSGSGQTVYVRMQRSKDGTQLLAAWEYNGYRFAILTDSVSEEADMGAIAKTALSIISNL